MQGEAFQKLLQVVQEHAEPAQMLAEPQSTNSDHLLSQIDEEANVRGDPELESLVGVAAAPRCQLADGLSAPQLARRHPHSTPSLTRRLLPLRLWSLQKYGRVCPSENEYMEMNFHELAQNRDKPSVESSRLASGRR